MPSTLIPFMLDIKLEHFVSIAIGEEVKFDNGDKGKVKKIDKVSSNGLRIRIIGRYKKL